LLGRGADERSTATGVEVFAGGESPCIKKSSDDGTEAAEGAAAKGNTVSLNTT
jgi:hypothetical protein